MGVRDRRIRHKDGSVTVMRYITWYLPGSGKPVTRSLGPASKITKTRAKEILSDIKTDLRKNKYEQYTAADPLLQEYAKQYIKYARDIQKKRSWGRDEIALKNLCKVLGELPLSRIGSSDLLLYQEKRLNDGRQPRTINIELSVLRRLLNIAKLQNKFDGDNPVSKIKFLEENYGTDRVLAPEEEKRLIQASPDHLRHVLLCALNTGMRRGEVVMLKWDNVDLAHSFILLESSTTKTKQTRKVPINSVLKDMLFMLQNKREHDYVFSNSLDQPFVSGEGIIKAFNLAKKRAKIKNFRFHDLRHTAATRMVESGIPLFTVGQILGHRNPKTTMRYAHPDESLKQGVEALASFNHDNYRNNDSLSDS